MSDRRPLDVGVFGARGIPSTYSGYETFLTALLPELVSRGVRITMYCRRGEVPDLGSFGGVRCVPLPALATKQLSTLSHGVVAGARATMAGHDVLLVVNVANAGVCTLARLAGRRVVLNTDGQEWRRGKWGSVARAVFLASAHLSRWSANAVVSDCAEMRLIYRQRFGVDSTVIPYCWTGLTPAPGPGPFEGAGVEPGGYGLVAARLVPENNVVEMARTFLGLGLQLPLVVLGGANYASPVVAELEAMAAGDPRLRLPGHVGDRRDFAALVGGARVYLHGHSVGGLNPSLLEAMGCGARIVALDTPFNREALGPSGDYFADPAVDLGPLIERVVSEADQERDRRTRAASERAADRFSLAAVADAYQDLLAAVADGPPTSRTTLPTPWEAEQGR